ncbi:MAG: Holliday junction resolvase RuvX [Lachnospiraceae bacterium]|nr:Holliday junction resolvase RuvX [Lachnospiraceae bacterium]
MRVMALDYGDATVGVAVSDPLFLTAQGIEIIRREKETHLRPTLRRIGELIDEYHVEAIVLGLPLNMDGSKGPRALKTEKFRDTLEKRFRLPVYMTDERLSSFEAEEEMREAGIKPSEFKKHVDRIAAQIILEEWMNLHGTKNNPL